VDKIEALPRYFEVETIKQRLVDDGIRKPRTQMFDLLLLYSRFGRHFQGSVAKLRTENIEETP